MGARYLRAAVRYCQRLCRECVSTRIGRCCVWKRTRWAQWDTVTNLGPVGERGDTTSRVEPCFEQAWTHLEQTFLYALLSRFGATKICQANLPPESSPQLRTEGSRSRNLPGKKKSGSRFSSGLMRRSIVNEQRSGVTLKFVPPSIRPPSSKMDLRAAAGAMLCSVRYGIDAGRAGKVPGTADGGQKTPSGLYSDADAMQDQDPPDCGDYARSALRNRRGQLRGLGKLCHGLLSDLD
jgi:hypothetical protein